MYSWIHSYSYYNFGETETAVYFYRKNSDFCWTIVMATYIDYSRHSYWYTVLFHPDVNVDGTHNNERKIPDGIIECVAPERIFICRLSCAIIWIFLLHFCLKAYSNSVNIIIQRFCLYVIFFIIVHCPHTYWMIV